MQGALQAHLSRLLDIRRVRPVGDDAQMTVDVQLVNATYRDLNTAVAAGDFRADRLHRIRTEEVAPSSPLGVRNDFAALAHALLADIDPAYDFDAEALGLLKIHACTGNVRELSYVRTCAVLACRAPTIHATAMRVLLAEHAATLVSERPPAERSPN